MTINAPVVHITQYVMVLRQARSITRGFGRGGPWKSRLFWALKWLRAKRVSWARRKERRLLLVALRTASRTFSGEFGRGGGANWAVAAEN